jgi:tetratricopeptide (TPR) repeat protein
MDDGYGYGYGSGQASAAALLFTHAIHDGPPTAALYAERAQAFIRMGNLAAAAADAAMAAALDPTMPRAFLRRARACIGLKRYGSAKAAVLAGAALAPGDPRFAELAKEIDEMVVVPGQRRAFPPPVGAGDHEQSRKFIGDVDAHGVPRPAAHRRAASWVL